MPKNLMMVVELTEEERLEFTQNCGKAGSRRVLGNFIRTFNAKKEEERKKQLEIIFPDKK